MYNYRVSPPICGREIVGRVFKCSLTAMNALLCLSPHSNFLSPLNNEKKGKSLLVDLDIKQVRIVILPCQSLNILDTFWFRQMDNCSNLI